jgi:hypothetical protein
MYLNPKYNIIIAIAAGQKILANITASSKSSSPSHWTYKKQPITQAIAMYKIIQRAIIVIFLLVKLSY